VWTDHEAVRRTRIICGRTSAKNGATDKTFSLEQCSPDGCTEFVTTTLVSGDFSSKSKELSKNRPANADILSPGQQCDFNATTAKQTVGCKRKDALGSQLLERFSSFAQPLS